MKMNRPWSMPSCASVVKCSLLPSRVYTVLWLISPSPPGPNRDTLALLPLLKTIRAPSPPGSAAS